MPTGPNTSQTLVNRLKRKADEEMPNSLEGEGEEELTEEEVTDEIYCRMTTNVVGIQYYKGPELFLSDFSCLDMTIWTI